MTHPDGISFGDFLDECLRATGSDGTPVRVDPAVLAQHGVKQWTELPLWRTHSGVWAVDARRAVYAGLRTTEVRSVI